MKKYLSIVLICMMIFGTGTAVYATGGLSAGTAGGNGSDTQMMNGLNSDANKEARGQMEQAREQIRMNHEEASQLRESIRDCASELRLQIKAAADNAEQLTPEEIAAFKEAIQQIRESREQLRLEHQGRIAEQIQMMRQARLDRDWDTAITAMDNIRAEQQLRIEDLTRILSEMEELLVTLSD